MSITIHIDISFPTSFLQVVMIFIDDKCLLCLISINTKIRMLAYKYKYYFFNHIFLPTFKLKSVPTELPR